MYYHEQIDSSHHQKQFFWIK